MAELITNGDMEDDSNWADVPSTTTNERSTEQKHGGSTSWKFEVDAQLAGIESDTFTVAVGVIYQFVSWIYPDDTTTVRLVFRKGDDSADELAENIIGLTENAWNRVSRNVASTTAGAGAYVQMLSNTDQTSGVWYIDDVSVKQHSIAGMRVGLGMSM